MQLNPYQIYQKMLQKDAFSRLLGMELIEIGLGVCILRLKVTAEMTNGFGVAHGGITFALADSAFAFACNSHGNLAVSIECSISHVAPVFENDEIIAECQEQFLGKKLSNYSCEIKNQRGEMVALFKSTAFRKAEIWV
jgi:acyl-CoA thioesterase